MRNILELLVLLRSNVDRVYEEGITTLYGVGLCHIVRVLFTKKLITNSEEDVILDYFLKYLPKGSNIKGLGTAYRWEPNDMTARKAWLDGRIERETNKRIREFQLYSHMMAGNTLKGYRDVKDLLQLVLDELDYVVEYLPDLQLKIGLCGIVYHMSKLGMVSYDEIITIGNYISSNMPKGFITSTGNTRFGWEPGDWKSRKSWLSAQLLMLV